MNLCDHLLNHEAPDDRIALLTQQGECTYGELRHWTARVARHLKDSGAVKGDRVLLVSESSLFWVAAYLGSIRAGCVSVPLPVNLDPAKLSYILENTRASRFFVQGRHLAKFQGVLPRGIGIVVDVRTGRREGAPDGVTVFSDLPAADAASGGAPVDDRRDLAAIMFTSGSTGHPRGVMITHRNVAANTDSIVQYLGLDDSDRMMAVLPFYYCFGTSLLHTHLRVGGSVVYDGRFMYPDKVLLRMVETRCTGFAGVPSTYMILLRSSNMKNMSFPQLRHVQQAGGKLPRVLISELREALPGTKVFVMYGQTEATARLSYLSPDLLDSKLGSIGKGMPGVTLEVLDEAGRPCAPGVVGEIVASGDNIGLGYWGSPEETARTFRGGRLHTGDLARKDEDGYIFVVDRAKDFLKCGGVRASSREIEEKVHGFPGTVEVPFIGQPDDTLGEAVRLYVVHKDGEAAAQALRVYCQKHLAWQLVPRTIVFLGRMPKNHHGKIDKTALKAVLATEKSKAEMIGE